MNNLLSYCGLVDARKSTSEKDVPVHFAQFQSKKTVKEDRIDVKTRNRCLKIAELNMIAKNAKKIGRKM